MLTQAQVQTLRDVAAKKAIVKRLDLPRLSLMACSALLSCGTLLLITRALGPAAFGRYMFVFWLATATIPAVGTGMSTLTSRHLQEIQGREEMRVVAGVFQFVWHRQYRHILLYCLIYFALVVPLALLYRRAAPIAFLLLAGVAALPLLLSGVVGITLRSVRRFRLLALLQLSGALAAFLLVIVVVTQAHSAAGERIEMLLLTAALAATFTLTLALFCIMRLLPIKQALPPGPFLKDRLTRGLSNSLLLFTLDVIVWQRSEILLLARGEHMAALGFYTLSAMISTRVMEMPPALLSSLLLPFMFRYLPGQRYRSAADACKKTSCYAALIAVPLCTALALYSPTLIAFCFGPAYLPAAAPLRILLVSAALGSIATISLTHLANGDRRRAQVRLGIAAAIVNVALAWPCITLWGITGAALASAAAQSISAVGSIMLCRRMMKGNNRKNDNRNISSQ
jgi:O-antigen/teichoic acid export membrane protein